jgi:hypothetical protein
MPVKDKTVQIPSHLCRDDDVSEIPAMSYNEFHEQTGEGMPGFNMYLLRWLIQQKTDMDPKDRVDFERRIARYEETKNA